MLQTILAISGKPGLYKLVSRGNNNLIVEAVDETHRRIPVFASDRVTSLADLTPVCNLSGIDLCNILQ